ncbi:MAG: hypothetical protein HY240_05445 [Actinobacteria bacterium]|nr:hypothetical protein [Actinomycetota bacterium]
MGSLVQAPFHGRLVRGWVLGPTGDVPARMLPVKKRVSPVRFVTPASLELLRWVSARYVSPLAAVIARSVPPRVASEEGAPNPNGAGGVAPPPEPSSGPLRDAAGLVRTYRGGPELLEVLGAGAAGSFVLRPAPEDELGAALDLVQACLGAGRRALVLVPGAEPVPATATAIVEAFGRRAGLLVGGDKRARFRKWLDVAAGRYDVVVGTRPAVFSPVPDLGLVIVSRESHAAHREDRAPYYHVRDVALARARIEDAVTVLSALCPSSEAAGSGLAEVAPASRRWPPVEVVKPGPEGRAPRLVRAVREARRGFLLAARPGYGVAQVCRACGEPAACAACGGLLRSEEGTVGCVVCEAQGRCRHCGASDFGIRRGGQERVQEWARAAATVPVRRLGRSQAGRLPGHEEILVGGPEDVRDLGPGGLDLVAILDADLAERRPGLAARERSLATWFEAAGWARPHGRVIVQASRAADPAVQALVRGNPDRFHADEARRRAAAGLLALEPGRVTEFGRVMRELAARGVVQRVEAEPHL